MLGCKKRKEGNNRQTVDEEDLHTRGAEVCGAEKMETTLWAMASEDSTTLDPERLLHLHCICSAWVASAGLAGRTGGGYLLSVWGGRCRPD
jgi:hypothetical protein